MATPAFKLADLNIGTAISDNWGRPTSYFQRFIQDMNRRIGGAIGDLTQVYADLAAQQVLILAQQVQIDDTIDTLDNLVDYLILAVPYLSGSAGVTSVTPDGSGNATIAHTLGFAPSTLGACQAFATGASPFLVQMQSVSSTDLSVTLFSATTGLPITAGTWPVAFRVTGYPVPPPPP